MLLRHRVKKSTLIVEIFLLLIAGRLGIKTNVFEYSKFKATTESPKGVFFFFFLIVD